MFAYGEGLLFPAHAFLPDCPLHSFNSTTSSLVGAMFPEREYKSDATEAHPYLLIFTFCPIQEFIKASRKFLDFWSGSYLLHYLSAHLCQHIAHIYGPDSIITPAQWNQPIFDALLLQSEGWESFREYINPSQGSFRISLQTAGLPNTITALLPSKEATHHLGESLQIALSNCWKIIGKNVREHIKCETQNSLGNPGNSDRLNHFWQRIASEFVVSDFQNPLDEEVLGSNPNYRELRQLQHGGCWEWNALWDTQISHSWETYHLAIPLGHPNYQLSTNSTEEIFENWKNSQDSMARPHELLPSRVEEVYQHLNVGTWWGSCQNRLGKALMAIKNTRTWEIPVAPGGRSSLSGLYSAVHPRMNYRTDAFKQGRGMSSGSIRLFWRVMAEVYPGLFNGSEQLNAIELTKRMAWEYGGIKQVLGLRNSLEESSNNYEGGQDVSESSRDEDPWMDYDQLIRFPNLSSLAAARFIHDMPGLVNAYQQFLSQHIAQSSLTSRQKRKFRRVSTKPTQIPNVDSRVSQEINRTCNGNIFSSKWLIEDMALQGDAKIELRNLVTQSLNSFFGEGSPADYWVLIKADGDNMGKYVSGQRLKPYSEYILEELVDHGHVHDEYWSDLQKTRKRMGPATHVALNRALLDFSNVLVPYLTETRFCGRVIFSGADDVLVALPLADLPEFLLSLRSAWNGGTDPFQEFCHGGGYWSASADVPEIPHRALFTMGREATMSAGIIIAHKSVPLPTILENLWPAEKDRAKHLPGQTKLTDGTKIQAKDGLCFRVIHGSGNCQEALLKGYLLEPWWEFVQSGVRDLTQPDISPLMHRLAEEIKQHAVIDQNLGMIRQVAQVVLTARDESLAEATQESLLHWLNEWEEWASESQSLERRRAEKEGGDGQKVAKETLGAQTTDLANLLRFTAFWVSRRRQELTWIARFEEGQP
jgi:CRISPR-associated protein Cmr2